MSFATNDQVIINDGTGDVTYTKVASTGTSTTYSDRTREIGVPRQLMISHQQTGKAPNVKIGSMIKILDTVESADETESEQEEVYIVCRRGIRLATKSQLVGMLIQIKNLVADPTALVDQLVNRET